MVEYKSRLFFCALVGVVGLLLVLNGVALVVGGRGCRSWGSRSRASCPDGHSVVKLLFDQNLSPKPSDRLADLYPGSEHVADVGLDRAMDRVVWTHAAKGELAIVSTDSDFSEMGVLRGFPPSRATWTPSVC